MGQVFTWDAIQNGRIPKKESFPHVSSVVRATLMDDDSVVAAVLFGSVARGDHDIRSDLDCAVVYKTTMEGTALETMQNLRCAALELHVPINFAPCDTMVAQTRLHHFGGAFREHLQAVAQEHGVVKGDIFKQLAPSTSPQREIENYLRMKLYTLTEGMTESPSYSDEMLARFLKKALEAPMHTARKMLVYESVLDGDSKQEVQQRYRETMTPDMADRLDRLLRLDAWYSSELEKQLKEPNRDHYTVVIEFLQEKVGLVLEFLRANLLMLNKVR